MKDIYIYAISNDDVAIEQKAYLEERGYTVNVYGKAEYITIDSTKLNNVTR